MAYDTDLSFIYKNPTRIVFGVNSLRDLAAECNELKCSKAFLVTDKGLVEAGLAEKVEAALGKLHVGTFDECPQDSGVHIVNQAADIAREKGADILVSLGGGSVIDTAKGVAILLKEGGSSRTTTGCSCSPAPRHPTSPSPPPPARGAR